MADWTDLSSAFGANTILTSAQQQQLRENITAAFEKAANAPVLANDYVTSSMIADDQIGAAHIANSVVNSYHLASGAIGLPLNADAAGRHYRVSKFSIGDGTSADTVKCQLFDVFNGDILAETDNIGIGDTSNNFKYLNASNLQILSSGLSGEVMGAFTFVSAATNATVVLPYTLVSSSNAIGFLAAPWNGAVVTWENYVDGGGISLIVVYYTDA